MHSVARMTTFVRRRSGPDVGGQVLAGEGLRAAL